MQTAQVEATRASEPIPAAAVTDEEISALLESAFSTLPDTIADVGGERGAEPETSEISIPRRRILPRRSEAA
jgi:hypothetical protein